MRRHFLLIFFIHFVTCRDFYVGMFNKNDFLVAHDRLYKERVPHRFTYAKYGRVFKCPITYFRVVDRLGVGRGPNVQIVRGGLRKKYLVLRVTSPYNHPISVNVYVGCENKMVVTKSRPITTHKEAKTTVLESDTTTGTPESNENEETGQTNPPENETSVPNNSTT